MEQLELCNRFEELATKVNQCKSVLQSRANYTTTEQVKEWSDTMKQCATELNDLFSDTLWHLATKLV
jgi:hypothetical protein